MSRKQAREVLFKMIFAGNFGGSADVFDYIDDMPLDKDSLSYIERVIHSVTINKQQIYDAILAVAKDFKPEEMYKVDYSILLLSVAEILFCDDIPDNVAANEAVDLAKRYSTDKSPGFINGVLSGIIKNKQ